MRQATAATERNWGDQSCDDGVGLVEIVVAMFLLALVSIAFLPLLINSLQLSIRNATISTATQVLNGEVDALATVAPTCEGIKSFVASSGANVEDDRGVTYEPERQLFRLPPEEDEVPPLDEFAPDCADLTYPTTVTVRLTIALGNTTVNELMSQSSFLLQSPGEP